MTHIELGGRHYVRYKADKQAYAQLQGQGYDRKLSIGGKFGEVDLTPGVGRKRDRSTSSKTRTKIASTDTIFVGGTPNDNENTWKASLLEKPDIVSIKAMTPIHEIMVPEVITGVDPQKLEKLREVLNPENLAEYCSMHPGWICDPSQDKDPEPPLPYFGDWLSSSRVGISTKNDHQFLGDPKEVRRGVYAMNLVPQKASPEAFFRFERIEERGTKGKTYYKIAVEAPPQSSSWSGLLTLGLWRTGARNPYLAMDEGEVVLKPSDTGTGCERWVLYPDVPLHQLYAQNRMNTLPKGIDKNWYVLKSGCKSSDGKNYYLSYTKSEVQKKTSFFGSSTYPDTEYMTHGMASTHGIEHFYQAQVNHEKKAGKVKNRHSLWKLDLTPLSDRIEYHVSAGQTKEQFNEQTVLLGLFWILLSLFIVKVYKKCSNKAQTSNLKHFLLLEEEV